MKQPINPGTFHEWAAKELDKDTSLDPLTKEEHAKLFPKWDKLREEHDCWKNTKPEPKVDERFSQPELLDHIHKELDKDHKLDHKEKLAVFIIAASAELPHPRERVSCALKGNSSAGKDNAVDTALKHFPKQDTYKFTETTPPSFRDSVQNCKRVALSEMNKNRGENGANNRMVEKLKQLAEGGISDTLQEKVGGKWIPIEVKSPQKTVIYSTTEFEGDEELDTRFIIIPILGTPEKNRIVNKDTHTKRRDPQYYLRHEIEFSWIANSIRGLDNNIQPLIPFTEVFEKPIKDGDKESLLIDNTKERSKRDLKRLYNLTNTITWLHQKQRCVKKLHGKDFIIAEPSDFITALIIFAEFFNLTYVGLDARVQRCYELIKQYQGQHTTQITQMSLDISYSDWVLRNKIQEELDVSLNTIKKYVDELNQMGLISQYYDHDSKRVLLTTKNSPVNSPISHLSLPVSIDAIDRSLTGWLTGENHKTWYDNKEIKPIQLSFIFSPHTSGQIDRCQIDTSKTPEICKDDDPLDDLDDLTVEDRLKSFLSEREVDNKELLVQEFSERQVEVWLRDGVIHETRPGTVRIL